MKTKDFLFKELFKDAGNVRDLPEFDTTPEISVLKAEGTEIQDVFTELVAFHREHFPNEAIRDLMVLFWDLVGHQVTPSTLMTAQMPGLSFYAERLKDGRSAAAIMAPINWRLLIKKNPYRQCGGLVFVASQARDYYNGKLGEGDYQKDMVERATAYEAEFINTLIQVNLR